MAGAFFQGKKVFVTGHTGFKGAWLCVLLLKHGAAVTGYSLSPEPGSLFTLCGLRDHVTSVHGDIRDGETLHAAVARARPDIVIHMAAQSLVLRGYASPHYTYDVNVMGTVNILESLRAVPVGAFINVTTDKVYRNDESAGHDGSIGPDGGIGNDARSRGFTEDDTLDGRDPYSNSKSCSELVTGCYRDSFFSGAAMGIVTVRSGNVIGGGDFSPDRIIPDCVRAALAKQVIRIRNPEAVRPYQHVLEPLSAYLGIARERYGRQIRPGAFNIGPEPEDCITTSALATLFCREWGENLSWSVPEERQPYQESQKLMLDCALAKNTLGWRPRWNIEQAVKKVVEWTRVYAAGAGVMKEMERQMDVFEEDTA